MLFYLVIPKAEFYVKTEIMKTKAILLILCILFFAAGYSQNAIRLETDPVKIAEIKSYLQNLDSTLVSNPEDGALHIKKASLHTALGEYETAKTSLTKAIDLNPDPAALFFLYYRRGDLNYKLQLLEESIADFFTAIQLEPRYEWAYLDRGMALADMGKTTDAQKDFFKALELKPNWGDALYCLGVCYQDQGEPQEAMDYFQQAVKNMDETALFKYKTYNNIGILYNHQQKYNTSISFFDKAIALNPNYALAYINRAIARYQLNDMNGVCADLQKAVELGRENVKSEYEKYCNP